MDFKRDTKGPGVWILNTEVLKNESFKKEKRRPNVQRRKKTMVGKRKI